MAAEQSPTLSKPLAVDRLEISILVDNCIEWMTKLPPGFTHELRQHLNDPDVPVDDKTGVPIVDLDNYCCGAHGLSILISTTLKGSTHHTLFDTGPEPHSITRNIHALKIPLASIDRVVLSHWHRDHSGGIVAFLQLASQARRTAGSNSKSSDPARDESTNTGIVVDVHADRPIARGIAPVDKVIARLPEDPTFEEIEAAGGIVETYSGEDGGHPVAGGTVWVSGEIPRAVEFEKGLLGGARWFKGEAEAEAELGEWESEPHIMDERYVTVDVKGKGLVIFSSCSHAGICNVAQDAIKRFSRPVYMIVAGLHLAGPELQTRIEPTVDFLTRRLRPVPTYVLPVHCTGFAAKVALEHALGEGCVPAGTGLKVVVDGDAALDDRLWSGEIVD